MSSTRSHNKYADAKNLIDLINVVMLQVHTLFLFSLLSFLCASLYRSGKGGGQPETFQTPYEFPKLMLTFLLSDMLF